MNINHWQVKLAYIHFSQRLEERFGMQITIEEYGALCRTPVTTIKKLPHNARLVNIEINGVKMRAVKELARNKCLKTVFPNK